MLSVELHAHRQIDAEPFKMLMRLQARTLHQQSVVSLLDIPRILLCFASCFTSQLARIHRGEVQFKTAELHTEQAWEHSIAMDDSLCSPSIHLCTGANFAA